MKVDAVTAFAGWPAQRRTGRETTYKCNRSKSGWVPSNAPRYSMPIGGAAVQFKELATWLEDAFSNDF